MLTWKDLARKAFDLSKIASGEVVALADWLELQCLHDRANSCYKITLEGALTTEEWTPPGTDDILDQAGAKDWAERAIAEIKWREQWFRPFGYPFRVTDEGRSIVYRSETAEFSPYLILLAISYIDPRKKAPKPSNERGAFLLEGLAWIGLNRWLGTHPADFSKHVAFVHHLGRPSLSNLPGAFHHGIDALAQQMRDGDGYRMPPHGRPQTSGDDGVDILAWRGFPDDLGGQFLLFAGCAAGDNYVGCKRREVDPDVWMRTNFKKDMPTNRSWARCYVVPRQMAEAIRSETSLIAGVVIDRCRLTFLIRDVEHEVITRSRIWLKCMVDCSHFEQQAAAA